LVLAVISSTDILIETNADDAGHLLPFNIVIWRLRRRTIQSLWFKKDMTKTTQEYIDNYRKSQSIGFILTMLFGPLGLFYSSWLVALIICIIASVCIITGILNIITVVAVCWPVAIIISLVSIGKHNESVNVSAQ
jgi:hypothetical protein